MIPPLEVLRVGPIFDWAYVSGCRATLFGLGGEKPTRTFSTPEEAARAADAARRDHDLHALECQMNFNWNPVTKAWEKNEHRAAVNAAVETRRAVSRGTRARPTICPNLGCLQPHPVDPLRRAADLPGGPGWRCGGWCVVAELQFLSH